MNYPYMITYIQLSLPDIFSDCQNKFNNNKYELLSILDETSKSHFIFGLPNMKFVCPKMKWEWNSTTKKSKCVCHCDNPCTTSSCGRMIYIYPEKNLHAYPGCVRDTEEWDSTYKICVNVKKAINHFKDSFCVAGRKTQNEKTLYSDLFRLLWRSHRLQKNMRLISCS